MSWESYITNLMEGGFVTDAAIVGFENGQESVWAAQKGGNFSTITPAQIRALVSKERSGLFAAGVTIGKSKCTVLRDALFGDGQNTMDLRTKATEQNPDTYSISIGKSVKALVLVQGDKDTHGGKLNSKVYSMRDHLSKSGY